MNKINFQQSVGFPLDTDILNAMQTAYGIFNALGSLAGDKSIISGCTTVGATVSNGVIFLNNEVLEFRGGVAQATVIVVEEVTQLEFEDLNMNDVVKVRYATFGIGTNAINWADFKRPNYVRQVPLSFNFEFTGVPPASLLLTHGLGTLDYVVVGEFESPITSPSLINDVQAYTFTVWQKTTDYCYVKVMKNNNLVTGGDMKVHFKILT